MATLSESEVHIPNWAKRLNPVDNTYVQVTGPIEVLPSYVPYDSAPDEEAERVRVVMRDVDRALNNHGINPLIAQAEKLFGGRSEWYAVPESIERYAPHYYLLPFGLESVSTGKGLDSLDAIGKGFMFNSGNGDFPQAYRFYLVGRDIYSNGQELNVYCSEVNGEKTPENYYIQLTKTALEDNEDLSLEYLKYLVMFVAGELPTYFSE